MACRNEGDKPDKSGIPVNSFPLKFRECKESCNLDKSGVPVN